MRLFVCTLLAVVVLTVNSAHAEPIPDWVKKTTKLWTEGKITDNEFLNAIRYLLNKNIIQVESKTEAKSTSDMATVVIPNGNSRVGNIGFYVPLNLQVKSGTTVVWVNDDNILHTIQSQDEKGNVISIFNSNALKTGDRFAYKFKEQGTYHYFCTIHPWRVGVVTVY